MKGNRKQNEAIIQAMYDAAYPGDFATMRRLLKSGGDPNGRPKGGELSVLELAAVNKEVPALARMLLKAGAKVTPRAVCEAAYRGSPVTLKLLLANGGDPNARMLVGRARYWRLALELIGGDDDRERKRKLELLLAAGADVNRSADGTMPAAVVLAPDRVWGDRVFALCNATSRTRILGRALLPRGTPEGARSHMLDVALLFLGKTEFTRKKAQIEAATLGVINKSPGAQLAYKQLVTGTRTGTVRKD